MKFSIFEILNFWNFQPRLPKKQVSEYSGFQKTEFPNIQVFEYVGFRIPRFSNSQVSEYFQKWDQKTWMPECGRWIDSSFLVNYGWPWMALNLQTGKNSEFFQKFQFFFEIISRSKWNSRFKNDRSLTFSLIKTSFIIIIHPFWAFSDFRPDFSAKLQIAEFGFWKIFWFSSFGQKLEIKSIF